MKKYTVTLQFQRTQLISVEAESENEAIEIVNSGEFLDENIVDTEDDYVEILGATLEN